jgi:hypothetical protein
MARDRAKRFAKKNPGTNELRQFIKTFEKFPADLRKEMRPMLKGIGQRSLARARQNAQWSSRIPSSLRVAVSFTKRSAGVTLVSNRLKAPHGRAYANQGRAGFFRAPTGSPPDPWVRHAARPWFFEVADHEMNQDIDRKIGEIVDTVASAHGFK